MKYLKIYNGLVGLLPKNIGVTLVDATTGKIIGKYKVPSQRLPDTFNRPVTLEIDKTIWQIMKADPKSGEDFRFTKKLTLEVINALEANDLKPMFKEPTICKLHPSVAHNSIYNNHILSLSLNDWRQHEFFSLAYTEVIEQEIASIQKIFEHQPDALAGFREQHIRSKSDILNLSISTQDLYSILINPIIGDVLIDNVYVKNGFAVKSDNHVYYGIEKDGIITTLCLSHFDYMDEEFINILEKLNLVFVDWCNANRFSTESGGEPKSEYLKI